MPIIANIVSNEKISVSDDFNVVKSMDEIIHGLPTLIVGFDFVNKNYPDFDIMNFKLSDKFYWTFKRTEKRDKFYQDLNLFVYTVYKDLTKDIKYLFIDPIQYRRSTLVKIIKKIHSLKNIVTYVNGNMIYMYDEGIIFGVDLKLLKYIGLNIDKIKNKIMSASSCFLSDDKILIEYKKTVEILDNQLRYIPFLYSINNG